VSGSAGRVARPALRHHHGERRLGTPDGMIVTVRRERDRVVLVVWGNSDVRLVQAWNALTCAFAEAGNGTIHTADGLQIAAEYWNRMNLLAAPGSNPESGVFGSRDPRRTT
jgi:hypothetical protein